MNPAVEVYLFICEHYFQSITFLLFIGFIVFIYIFRLIITELKAICFNFMYLRCFFKS